MDFIFISSIYYINMIKCKCVECHSELVYENHKQAWMDGWDFVNSEVMVCGECIYKNKNNNNNKNEKSEE